ncbi:hypothetical protein [Bradyrhizobium liaoningense]
MADGSTNLSRQHPEYAAALEKARKEGATGDVYRVEDAWGGYWQCASPYGPYMFRIGKASQQ